MDKVRSAGRENKNKDERKINEKCLRRKESGHIKGEERRGERRNMAEGLQCLCSEKFPKRASTLKSSNAALPPSAPSEAGNFFSLSYMPSDAKRWDEPTVPVPLKGVH